MYPLFREMLFRLDAEAAHDLTLAGCRAFAGLPRLPEWLAAVTQCRDTVTKAGLTFPHRVGLAGGLDKNGVAPRAWWAMGFGFLELGTVTPRVQAGNPKPRMFRLPGRGAVVNRMGFNNGGAAALADRLKAAPRPPIPVGVSVGKQFTTPVDDLSAVAADYADAARVVAPVADFVSVNVSSPNTSGLRTLQTGEAIRELVTAVVAVVGGKPLLVKVAPELTGNDLRAVVDSSLKAGAAGMIGTNTLAQFDAVGKPLGGLSGKPLHELSVRRVEELRRYLGDEPLLIGCGGIDSVASARRMVGAGADLIQIYTGLVYRGPFLPARLSRGLRR